MRGNWSEVWDSFDGRKTKIIGIEAASNDGMNVFEQAGVAAE